MSAKEVVITADDLAKSLGELTGKKPEGEGTDEVKVVFKTSELLKSLAERVQAEGSEELKKSLDVSSTLKEVVDLVGVHVDSSLAALKKSHDDSAERDSAIIQVLKDLKKSIDENTAAVKEFGNKPAGAPKSAATTATTTQPLVKGLNKEGSAELDPARAKARVSEGLQILAKSATKGSQEQMAWTSAAVKFESTGEISDANMARALEAAKTGKA